MNKKLIRLTESDLHSIVKESVNRIINEIGDTDKGQDALGQIHGRAVARQHMVGGKGAISRKLHNTARAAKEKAYSQAPNHDIYDGTPFDIGISKGYKKAKTNESYLNRIVRESVNRIIKENSRRNKRMIREFDEFDDFDEFEEEEFIDRKGQPIHKGSKVIWYDPERSARDLKRVWTVYDMEGDIVYIADDYSEAEVLPEELKVVG